MQLVMTWDWLRMHNTTERCYLSRIVITRNASLVHSWALLVNHARELKTRTREYTAHERKVTSELYRNCYYYDYYDHCKIHLATCTSGKQSHSIEFPLFDFINDFTSPLCMNGIIISGIPLSGSMLTPMRLRTLGWSKLLLMLHSSMNSCAPFNVRSK